MTAPTEPLQSSAEATTGTIIEVRWEPPTDDGGFALDFYTVEVSINGGAFVFESNVNAPTTAYTDSGLTPNNNFAYRISATNLEPLTGPFSDTASSTTTSSEAQTIKELLFNNWSLTGLLAKTTTGNMTEPVHFFDRGQVPGNKYAKAITVQKVNALGNESIIEHPRYLEQSDTFEISCFLQVIDSGDDRFSQWIDLMQQMTSEVIRILKTVFSPSAQPSLGEFFRTTTDWSRDDTFFPDDPELTRTLRFTLTRIVSNDDTVYLGYPDDIPGNSTAEGLLVFDTSGSEGDNKPVSDYAYVQATRIELNEGWTQLPYLTKDKTNGVGVPQYGRGIFSGVFSARMFGKKDDITGATLEKIANIYKPQSNSPLVNQTANVVILQNNINTESTPKVLETISTMKINRITKVSETEQLLTFRIDGTLIKPSLFEELP